GNIGTAAQNINTAATNLTANTTVAGNVFINQNGAVTLGASSAGATFQLTDNANLTIANPLSATTVTLITTAASNGNIIVNANPTATATLNVTAGGSGNITQAAGVAFTAPTVSLTSGTGNVGTAAQNINTAATNLTASTTVAGNVFINQNGAVNLGASSAGATFQLTDNANLTITNPLSATTVTLITTAASNGNIIVNANPTATATLNVNAGGSGNITQAAGVTFTAPTVNLSSG